MLKGLFVAIPVILMSLPARPSEDCENRLVEVANRYANDYNSYLKRYHVNTVSANPNEKEQARRRKRLKEEVSAVERCECW